MLQKSALLALLLVFLVGCNAKKKTIATTKKSPIMVGVEPVKPPKKKEKEPIVVKPVVINTPKKPITYTDRVSKYIDDYSTISKEEMLQYGIPASITLAQGILESGAGNGALTQKAKNHFGIKCHKEWTGERVYHDDDELQECFRKYNDPKYSFRDHSLFLTSRARYQDLFRLKKDDYKGWAKGLKKAGYATDPKYPNKLISIIERYNLTSYDAEVLGKSRKSSKKPETKIESYTVQSGDTLYNISRRFNVSVATLKEYNGLKTDTISIGQVLYLHPNLN